MDYEVTPHKNQLAIETIKGRVSGLETQHESFIKKVDSLIELQKETQQQLESFVVITMNHINSTKVLQSVLNKIILFIIVGVATYVLPKILDVAVPMLKEIILK